MYERPQECCLLVYSYIANDTLASSSSHTTKEYIYGDVVAAVPTRLVRCQTNINLYLFTNLFSYTHIYYMYIKGAAGQCRCGVESAFSLCELNLLSIYEELY